MKAWCFWLATAGLCLLLAPVFAIGLLFRPVDTHAAAHAATRSRSR